MSARRLLAGAALALGAFTGTGCTDATGLDENDVAGLYEAVQFIAIQNGFQEDLLDTGGYMWLELSPSGLSQGEIFIPEGGEFGQDLFVLLDGEWEVRGDRVYVYTDEDTFLNDAPFEIESSRRLTMDRTFQSGSVRLIVDLRREF